MHNKILQDLQYIEKEQQVTILFACESGSRAWGFASPDSDYDVRFIYVHPQDWYLSINEKADHISPKPDEVLDYKGWEIRKALQLLYKSNASIFEYAQSPVVYRHNPAFVARLRQLLPQYFSPRACLHHYLGLAGNAYDSLKGKEKIKLKKYFYVLRSLLSAMWIVDKNEYAPMEFHILQQLITDPQLNSLTDSLLAEKIKVNESGTTARTPALDDFIEHHLARCRQAADQFERKQADPEPLNHFFRELLLSSAGQAQPTISTVTSPPH